MEFEKGDIVFYDNGTYKERFTVYSSDEYKLYSTNMNQPSFNKKYCNKLTKNEITKNS